MPRRPPNQDADLEGFLLDNIGNLESQQEYTTRRAAYVDGGAVAFGIDTVLSATKSVSIMARGF